MAGRLLLLVFALSACKGSTPAEKKPSGADSAGEPEPPLGMVLVEDGVTYAGAAAVDITPVITETFSDLDGDATFEGCLDDPDGSVCGGEPFDDANGNGWFDAVWIGGFGPLRPAQDVHDPIYARATVISQDGEYIAFVALDLVGLGSPRIHAARDRLVADGFDIDRLIVSSSHNHQGPDSMGLWGNPYNFAEPVSGMDPAYQERVTDAIEQAVRQAAGSMKPVELKVGTVHMRDRDPYLSGSAFGGKNPTPKMHGMIYDGRDPVLVSDQLLVMQGMGQDGEAVFTLTNWSGHPETKGSNNSSISSDWVGVTREVLEARYGGVALHLPESLGGMQSALGGNLPLVNDDGTHMYQVCSATDILNAEDSQCFGRAENDPRVDSDGLPVPAWAPHESWEFVTSHGWLIAEAAFAILDEAEPVSASPIRVEAESLYVPIENLAYQLLGPKGIFDLGLEDAIFDTDLCPLAASSQLGCIETRTFRVQVGNTGFVAVPGELLPELAWGFPDDPQWELEASDPSARGADAGARYFPQHPRACDTVDYEDCRDESEVEDCNCLAMHALPYRLNDDASVPPLLELVETEHRAVIGMADNYLSYIVPEPDFNTSVSLLSSNDGDHYEDTVSPSHVFATEVQRAQLRIQERW